MQLFEYGQTELDFLSCADEKMALLISKYGKIEREIIPDLYAALVNSIIAQQISGKTANNIWSALQNKVGAVTPQNIVDCSDDELRALGMSLRKVRYIKSAAEKIISGELDIQALKNLSDDEVSDTLVKLDGVGVWTAQMLMIFSMQRKNIFSTGDFGIKKGISILYGCEAPNKALFNELQKRYSPYCTIASFYLWQLANLS